MAVSEALLRKMALNTAKEHLLVVGQIVYAANELHDQFYSLFAATIALERSNGWDAGITFHNHALAIWHTVQSDSAQRDMAWAAISTVPTELKLAAILERLKWAKGKADILSPYRNLLAHNPIRFRVDPKSLKPTKGKHGVMRYVPVVGGQGTRPGHRDRLDLLTGLRPFQTIRDDILKLSQYVNGLVAQIQRIDAARRGETLGGAPNSLPDKPRLRSLRIVQAIDRTLGLAVQKSKQRNRRRPSRASRRNPP